MDDWKAEFNGRFVRPFFEILDDLKGHYKFKVLATRGVLVVVPGKRAEIISCSFFSFF